MSAAADFRVSCAIFDHPKWLRLQAELKVRGCLCLLKLWSWARVNKPNGDLSGLTALELEHAARWRGRRGALVAALRAIGWIDGEDGALLLHDWSDHQGWSSGSVARSRAGKIGAITKQCRKLGVTPDQYLDDCGGAESRDVDLRERLREAYAKSGKGGRGGKPKAKHGKSNGSATGVRSQSEADVNAGPPSPSPYPSPTPTPMEGGDGADASAPPDRSGSEAQPRCKGCGRPTTEVTLDTGLCLHCERWGSGWRSA